MDNNELRAIAKRVREDTLKSVKNCGSGHPGGCLSATEILVSLYFDIARPTPYYDPDDPNRDIIILSKGHAAPVLYSVWQSLIDFGLDTPSWWGAGPVVGLRKFGSVFQGHPSRQHTPWCETSTGSLGQGLAVGVGMALALKGTGRRVFVVLGDGECEEGVVAESARISAHYQLNNLVVIVDYNGLSSDRHSIMTFSPSEFAAWGWNYYANVNGHNFGELRRALTLNEWYDKSRPTAIIAHTTKAKGVPSWEAMPDRIHGSVTLSDADLAAALKEIDNGY